MPVMTAFSNLTKRLLRLYWSIFYGAARVIALLMLVATVVSAVALAVDTTGPMDAPLRWGLVILLSVIAIICFKALRAPTKR